MSAVKTFLVSAIGYNRSATMAASRFPRIVSLACHDLRTPLATVYGFARTLTRSGDFDERSARFLEMIEEASEQMTALLDELGVAARIAGERWEPPLVEVDTLELATSDDERVGAEGRGETIQTERESIARALEAFAIAAVRHGPVERATWHVDGRSLELTPVTQAAAPVLLGDELKDLGSVVGRMAIEELGGSVAVDGETLRVEL
jgi:signal transduction histidine kinase